MLVNNMTAEHAFFLFFLFSMIGWVQESIIESVYHRRLINRGFLHGPYIPIYGFGGMTIIIVCSPFKYNGFLVYFAGLTACTILEYFVGWFMETVFKKQFWDYSMLRFTYKNRISLISSLFWGLMSLLVVYVIQNAADDFYYSLPRTASAGCVALMMIFMAADIIYTVHSHLKLSEKLKSLSREQIKRILNEKLIKVSSTGAERFFNIKERISFHKSGAGENHSAEVDDDESRDI